MLCKNCNAEIPENAVYCPACGKPVTKMQAEALSDVMIDPASPPKRKVLMIVIGIIAGILFVCFVAVRDLAGITSLLAMPITLAGFFIQAIRRKPKKHWGIAATVFFLIFWAVILFPSPCSHEWGNADCTTARTCSLCGKVEGSALGHDWQDATCTKASACNRCGKTIGEPLGHDLVENSCSRCNATLCEISGHTPGEWVLDEPDFISAYVWKRQYCEVCGKSLDSELKGLDKLHINGTFLLSPEELSARLGKILAKVGTGKLEASIAALDDGTMGCGINLSRENVAVLMFINDGDIMDKGDMSSKEVTSMLCRFYTDETDTVVEALMGLILTCDPTLDISDAADVGKEIITSMYQDNTYYEENGIKYLFGETNGNYDLIISVLAK